MNDRSAASGRWRLLWTAVAAALVWIALVWMVSTRYHDAQVLTAIQAAAKQAERQADSIAGGIDRMLSVRRGIAITFAEDETIRRAAIQRIAKGTPKGPRVQQVASELQSLNHFLRAAEQHLTIDALWIGDANGIGMAAQSADARDSPIGVDYSDRVYFQQAKAGKIGYQYAVGRTTGLGGIYFSAPIMDDNRFVGFVLAKTNVSRFIAWVEQADALVSDANGVVIMASDKRLEMRKLPGATVGELTTTERQRQYVRTEFQPIEITDWPETRYSELKHVEDRTTPVLLRARSLPDYGLTVTILRPMVELATMDSQRSMLFLSVAGIGVLLLGIIAVSAAYTAHIRATQHLSALQTQRLDEAQQLAHAGSWEFDRRRNLVTWSEEARRIFELPPGQHDSSYEAFLATIHADDRDMVDQCYRDSVARRVPGDVVHRLSLASGAMKFVRQRWLTHYDAAGTALRSSGSVQDITESQRVESRLRLAASVFDNANEGICITDAEQRIVDVNPTLCQLTGYPREALIGMTPRLFKSDRQDSAFYASMWRSISTDGHWHGELWNRHRNGELYAVRLTISAVRDLSGHVTHFIGILVNVTATKQHVAQLEHVAHFDALTGLPNRLLLGDRLRQAIAQTHRGDTFLAVCYLDLDEFKPINDQYGHDTGDQVLTEVARRLNACLRGGDTVARLGGDEFVLLLSGLRRNEEYEATLHRVLDEIRAPLTATGHTISISASIGVSLCPRHSTDQDTLLRQADQAMYRAKQTARNCWRIFDPAEGDLDRSDTGPPII